MGQLWRLCPGQSHHHPQEHTQAPDVLIKHDVESGAHWPSVKHLHPPVRESLCPRTSHNLSVGGSCWFLCEQRNVQRGDLIHLSRNTVWAWVASPFLTILPLAAVVHLLFFFFFFPPDITCLHCKDMYASAEWRLWKGATPPGVLDVRSLCPLLPASGKSFYKLPPTPAAISTQEIPVLTANMQKFGVWPPCLLTQTITCSGKGTNEPFCRERVSSGASATAAHKTWQYPNSQMWGQKLERLSWWEHRVISSLLPLLVFGFVYPSELNLME